ncbi:MAG: ATP-binding cassette domain-containing protein [Clostridia bacterium]|nr:ATP-binding cassette domain-containing protein [Clostridia bacterium]
MKLVFENISKSYGKNKALSDFSAQFSEGVYALLGPNGSGKSTLMNILTDNLKADSGSIYFDGENVLKMGARFREKIGFMPQYPGLYGSFTAESFLWYIAALKGINKKTAELQIGEVLTAVELSDVANHRISTFSGGMKQRLALAQAVLGDPSVLILDEPTAGLDPKQRIAIRNYISRISFDKIVIIATHVVPDIEYIAKDVIMLKKGVIVDNAPPAELLQKIDGRVWRIKTKDEYVQDYQNKYKVTNILKDDDGVSVRILSDERPDEAAIPVVPTLDDYYLHVFGE